MDWKLEVVILPVTDVDRSIAFYTDQLGFNLDVDHKVGDQFRVVQVTPPGSACSVVIGVGVDGGMAPGSVKGLHLVVNDIEAAQAELTGRGVDAGEIFHFGDNGRTAGLHPTRDDYGSFLAFDDPDGNSWQVQEVPSRS